MDVDGMKGGGAIRFDGVSKRYGRLTVVDSIDLDIHPGEFFSLLGPSGSGKTTTLMLLAGFATPDAGRILLDGVDISQTTPQQRNLGMVFQNYALFPHMTVLENVMFPLRVRKYAARERVERARWAIDLVRLGQYADRLPKELSGGQQQRVALARAVVFHPKVILMDEPLGALDKNLRYQMQMEIKDLQRRLDMTVVFVTHDQEEAMNMSDRIAIMNNGGIEQLGEPKEVYEAPCNPFTAGFLGEANFLPYAELSRAHRQQFDMGPEDSLFIRPERTLLSAVSSDDMSGLEGRIVNKSFLGHVVRYQVLVGEQLKIYADMTNLAGMPDFDTGAAVRVGWKQFDDVRVLRHG